MGDGRFLRQDNGDYIHVTEEEYWSGKSTIAIIAGFVIGGIAYLLGIDWFNLDDFGFIFFLVGVAFVIIGIVGLLIVNQSQKVNWGLTFGFIFGTLLVLGGLYWFFSRDSKDKKEEKKQDTTEMASLENAESNTATVNYSDVVEETSPEEIEEEIESDEQYADEDKMEEEQVSSSKDTPIVEDRVYDVVEQMPTYPGGEAAMMQFISSNVRYPSVAEENGVQGRVGLSFVIECDGSIGDVRVEKSVDPSLDKEAVRVIRSMPRWKAGTQNGKPVRVKYSTSVSFSLQ